MKRTVLVLTLGLISLVASQRAKAGVLGTYNFNTADTATPTDAAANVTFSQFGRTGLTRDVVTGRFASSAWSSVGTDLNEYVQFTLTPVSYG